MKNKRTKTEQANIDLNKALDGENRNDADTDPLTNNGHTETEEANIELNKALNGEYEDQADVSRLINNNHISLVLSNKKDKEDVGVGK